MKKFGMAAMSLLFFGAGWLFGWVQRTPQDLIRQRIAAPAGGEFLDVQIVTKHDDRLLQILALRRSAARTSLGVRGTGQTGAALGLWHAYQAPDGSWVSNGTVYEWPAQGSGAKAALGNLRLAAASDKSGRLHAVVLDAKGGGWCLYLLRGADSQWRASEIELLAERLDEPCLVPHPESESVVLIGLAGGTRPAGYELSLTARSGEGEFFWAKDEYPAELRAASYAVTRDDRYLFFLFQIPGGEFRGAERHITSGKWLLEPQKFMRGFRDPIGGAELRSLSGFRDAGGLMQVVGLAGGGGVVHIYRDEIGTWYNNGIALKAPALSRISGAVDGRGLIHVVGLTEDGRIWHGWRAESHEWRDNGIIFEQHSK
ncbi:MAG: hypothetical protein JW747_00635 [Candidatus Aminicenantes bacterium]|nr:hypothetical protein [Candidatus Aminicenantes bacterium]